MTVLLPIDDIDVEIAPGADPADPATWGDFWVSLCEPEPGYPDGRVQRPISINVGRQSEGSEAPPTWCSFEVRNEDGALSPDNPLGPWHGLLGKGTPLRVTWGTSVRFEGHISELPTTWLGRVQNSRVQIRADGITRRLMQGAAELESALVRATTRHEGAVAYWPMEEPSGALQAFSPLRDVSPMQPKGPVEFGQGDGHPAGSQPQAMRVLPGATSVMGQVPAVTASQWLVSELFRVNEIGGSDFRTAMSAQATGTAQLWRIRFSDTQIQLIGTDMDGTAVVTSTQSINFNQFFGQWLFITLSLTQNGTAIDWAWSVRAATPELTNVNGTSGSLASSTVGRVSRAGAFVGTAAPEIPERWIGHVTVLRGTGAAPVYDTSAIFGHAGELAGERFQRLCQEENLHCTVVGGVADTMPMGAQRTVGLLDLFREIEQTDGGILTDLTYRTRASLYNQTPVEIDFCDLNSSPESTHDDRFTRNDVVAARVDGSSARHTDDVHVAKYGRYDDSVTVNTATDDWLPQVASWRVHLGTTDASRWPTVPVSINSETLHIADTVLGLRPGDRLQIPHDIPQLPGVDVDLLVEGWSETIFSRRAEFVFNCTPAAPWSSLFTVEDDTLGRIDSDAYLAEDIATSDTSFDVVVPVRRAMNRGSTFEEPVEVVDNATAPARQFRDFAVFGGTLVRSDEQAFRGSWSGKFTPDGTTGFPVVYAQMLDGAPSGVTYTGTTLVVAPAGGVNVRLRLRWLRGLSILSGDVTSSSVALSAGVWTRLHVTGSAPAGADGVQLRFFLDHDPPTASQIVHVDEFEFGVQGQPFTTAGGDLPFGIVIGGERMTVTAVGAMTATGLQQLTVARAANGLAKAHPAGSDVRLSPAAVLAL